MNEDLLAAVRSARAVAVNVLRLSLGQLEAATPNEAEQALSVIADLFSDPGEMEASDRQQLQSTVQSLLGKVMENAGVQLEASNSNST